MYRVESEQSLGDSDENIMEHLTEGGVTILKQLDRKRQVNVMHTFLQINGHYLVYVTLCANYIKIFIVSVITVLSHILREKHL